MALRSSGTDAQFLRNMQANTGLFGIDGGVAQYKKKKGEVYTDEFVQPHWAGTYGVYVSTNSENSGIDVV